MNKTVRRMRDALSGAAMLIGAWLDSRLEVWLLRVMVVLVLLSIGSQLGIRRGRTLEREAIAQETATLGKAIASLEARIERLRLEQIAAAIIECESNGRHDGVWGDGGRSYGITQTQKRTFYWLAKKAGMTDANWKSREDQIELLKWAVKNGYGYLWTCYQDLAQPPLGKGRNEEG